MLWNRFHICTLTLLVSACGGDEENVATTQTVGAAAPASTDVVPHAGCTDAQRVLNGFDREQIHDYGNDCRDSIITWYVEGGLLDGQSTLLLSQARFSRVDGQVVPDPATLEILGRTEDGWSSSLLTDPESAVFHKAIIYEGGILSISGGIPDSEQRAHLKFWTSSEEGWTAETLWTSDWESGKHRLRDFEIGDVDGDGVDEIVIATHDLGLIYVFENFMSSEEITEVRLTPDPTADIYVHEIELGDIDGDGVPEIFATPSDPNQSGETQQGDVVMYQYRDGAYRYQLIDHTDATHAKEILVADLDGNGISEVFSAVEAEKRGGDIVGQVEIRQFVIEDDTTVSHRVIATLDDEAQLRFMMAHDFDGDEWQEIVIAPMNTGLFLLDSEDGGESYQVVQIADGTGGFEHASNILDPSGTGAYGLYVADDSNMKALYLYQPTD